MSNRTISTMWEIMSKDDTGALINIDYICPYCDSSTGEIILVGADNVDKIDNGFETDQVCGNCYKDLIIECRK